MYEIRKASKSLLPMLTLGALLSTTSTAFAGTRVDVSPNGFSTTPIIVISEDGKQWTKVKNTPLHLGLTIGLGKTDELVLGYKIRQGWLAQTSEKPWQLVENYGNARASVDKNVTLYGGTAHFTPAERTMFIKACNAKLSNGASINQTQKFFSTAKVQLFGSFTSSLPAHQANAGGLAGKYGNGVANVQVICKKVIGGGPGGIVAKQPKVLKVKSLELFRSTYKNAVTKPNPATTCKKLRVLVRLKTNKAGPVKFKLWTKVGDQPMTSETIDAWSKFSGTGQHPGQYKAEYTKWISVSKTSFIQAKAEETINPIGMSTPWKSITLKCSSGGFATNPKDDADQQTTQNPNKRPKLTANPSSKKPKRRFIKRPVIKSPLVKRPLVKKPLVKRPSIKRPSIKRPLTKKQLRTGRQHKPSTNKKLKRKLFSKFKSKATATR